jgi:RNA polymerase sigma-70 factor, ECF subfamily
MNSQPFAATICADYASLVAMLTRKLRDVSLAEDLVHEAFVESLDKLQRGRIADPSRFSGFVYAVALNLLRNHRRLMDNRVAAQAAEEALDSLCSDSSPFEQSSREVLGQQVRAAIEELPVARDRDALRTFYLMEQDKAAVSHRFGIEPHNLDKILFRARRRVRRRLLARGLDARDAV